MAVAHESPRLSWSTAPALMLPDARASVPQSVVGEGVAGDAAGIGDAEAARGREW